MANHQLLDEVKHRNLRVHTGYGAEYGDGMMCTLAIPSEFNDLVSDYPIFLHKDQDTGKLMPMVMFGFEAGENLFLEGDRWDALYIPLMVQRGPFLIGFKGGRNAGLSANADRDMMVAIDMDNPRVGDEGELMFKSEGGHSEYIDRVVSVLQRIDEGQPAIDAFAQALEEHDLVEPFSLDVRLDSGSSHQLTGFYGINEVKLAELSPEVLAEFAKRGILHAAYMILASFANVPRLIRLRNLRGGPSRDAFA